MGGSGTDNPHARPAVEVDELTAKATSREDLLCQINELLDIAPMKYPVKVKVMHDKGLMEYKAVFWVWMRHLTKELKTRWPHAYGNLDKEGYMMHDIMCTMFLGKTKAFKAGKTLIEPRMKTLTNPPLGKGEFQDLLRRIEEWSVGIGIPLPLPPSKYTEAK